MMQIRITGSILIDGDRWANLHVVAGDGEEVLGERRLHGARLNREHINTMEVTLEEERGEAGREEKEDEEKVKEGKGEGEGPQ